MIFVHFGSILGPFSTLFWIIFGPVLGGDLWLSSNATPRQAGAGRVPQYYRYGGGSHTNNNHGQGWEWLGEEGTAPTPAHAGPRPGPRPGPRWGFELGPTCVPGLAWNPAWDPAWDQRGPMSVLSPLHPTTPTPDRDYYLYVSLHHIDNIEGPGRLQPGVAWHYMTTTGHHPERVQK